MTQVAAPAGVNISWWASKGCAAFLVLPGGRFTVADASMDSFTPGADDHTPSEQLPLAHANSSSGSNPADVRAVLSLHLVGAAGAAWVRAKDRTPYGS